MSEALEELSRVSIEICKLTVDYPELDFRAFGGVGGINALWVTLDDHATETVYSFSLRIDMSDPDRPPAHELAPMALRQVFM